MYNKYINLYRMLIGFSFKVLTLHLITITLKESFNLFNDILKLNYEIFGITPNLSKIFRILI